MNAFHLVYETNWQELCSKLKLIVQEQKIDIDRLEIHADELYTDVKELHSQKNIFKKM